MDLRTRALLFSLLALACACAGEHSGKVPPPVQDGELDLRGWDFEKDGPVNLRGPWEFFWEEFRTPGSPFPDRGSTFAVFPGSWTDLNKPGVGSQGYASYRLRIRIDDVRGLSVMAAPMNSSYRLFCGELEMQAVGRPGKTPAASVPRLGYRHSSLPGECLRGDSLVLTVHMANFHHRRGGSTGERQSGFILINTGEANTVTFRRYLSDLSLLAIAVIMALYQFVFWSFRRSDSRPLWFSAVALLFSVRILGTQQILQNIFPATSLFELSFKFEYIGFYMLIPVFYSYIRSMFPAEFSRIVGVLVWFVSSLFTAHVILTPVLSFSQYLKYYYLVAGFMFVFTLAAMGLAVGRRRQGAWVVFIGILVVIATAANDIILNLGLIEGEYIAPLGFLFFLFCQSSLKAALYSETFKRAENLSQTLEHKVEDRTRALKIARADTESLADLSRKVNAGLSLPEILGTLMELIHERFHANSVALFTVEPDRRHLVLHDVFVEGHRMPPEEYPKQLTRLELVPSSGALYHVFRRRRLLYSDRIDPKWLERHPVDEAMRYGSDIKWFVYLPMLVDGEVIGILTLKSDRESLLQKRDLEFAERVGAQVAGAVRTLGLLKETVEVRRQTQALADLSRQATESNDLQAIIDSIHAFVSEQFKIENVVLVLPEDGALKVRAYRLPPAVIDGNSELVRFFETTAIPIARTGGSMAWAFRKNKTLHHSRLSDTRTAPSKYDRLIREAMWFQSYAHVPLTAAGQVIGILGLSSREEVALNQDQLRFLQAMGAQVAGAVQAATQLEAVRTARAESDRLLANILPGPVAEELKREGRVEPLHYESVSVLFTDFVGFTEATGRMSPEELIKELDGCFSQFDAVILRNGLEKLKTIGDAYMCAGGLPQANETHPIDACLCALEFRAFMDQMAQVKMALGHDFWRIRIGIHSGPVTAGVIGTNKFAYDIWGDTVNVASRMESSGQPDRINISEDTYELVKDYFEFEHRGRVRAKGMGEIDMFFLERIKPELSADREGLVPNALFETMRFGDRSADAADRFNRAGRGRKDSREGW